MSIIAVNLCSDSDDKLKIYRQNFEKAYLDAEIEFYNKDAQKFISNNGIIEYLNYAEMKFKEEKRRAEERKERGDTNTRRRRVDDGERGTGGEESEE